MVAAGSVAARVRRLAGVLVLAAGLPCAALAQATPEGRDAGPEADEALPAWEEMMQQLAEEGEAEDEQAWEAEADALAGLRESGLDLNGASREQLEALPFLSGQAVEAILRFRTLNGPFRSVSDLRLVGSLNYRERLWLRAVGTVAAEGAGGRRTQKNSRGLSPRHELTMRADVPLYERAGWPWRRGIAHRLRYTVAAGSRWEGGLRVEKDAGEALFARANRFWDSYGGYVALHAAGRVRSAVAGDFRAAFGEGLVVNSGLRLGKMSAGLWRTPQGIRPHRSADEVRFFRGAAATVAWGRAWELTAFYSHRRLDAAIGADNSVSAIASSGLHRTEGELARKGTLASRTAALHAGWQRGSWRAGATALFQHYDHQFRQPPSSLYRQIYPEGYRFGYVAADYAFRGTPLTLAGETARSFDARGGGWATLNKASWRLAPDMQVAVLQRFYSQHYYSPHASAYGEGSRVQNESGLSVLADAGRVGPLAVHAGFDVFYSPWPRYSMTRSSAGWEATAQATYAPRRRSSLTLRYRVKSKEQSDTRRIGHQLRATWGRTAGPRWALRATALLHRSRQAGTAGGGGGSTGGALAPRADYTSAGGRLRLSLQGVVFRSDDFDSRLSLYEPSLLQSFGLQQLYGRGRRLAATLGLRPGGGRWTWQAKAGVTHYADRQAISSGSTRIASAWKADVQMLVRWRL